MAKEVNQTLLKIDKAEYPEIYDFLENVPRGTKTAHIREALIRYINDINSIGIVAPTRRTIEKTNERDNHYEKPVDNKKEDNSKKELSSTVKTINDVDEKDEMVELDINLI